ncbi:MAG: hypothetical protein JNL19_01650 [Burkholderiales bacterium]|nr:hypothetical protein [Burkholderiales bacterium]
MMRLLGFVPFVIPHLDDEPPFVEVPGGFMLTVLFVVAFLVACGALFYYAPDLIGWLLAIACGLVALTVLAPLFLALLIPLSMFGIVVAAFAILALVIAALLLWPLLFLS